MELIGNTDVILNDRSSNGAQTDHAKSRLTYYIKRLILLLILIMCALELLLFFIVDLFGYRQLNMLNINTTQKIQQLFKKIQ